MGLTRLAIARPVVILMMVAAFLVLGFVAFARLPEELNPEVDLPRVTVVTQYTGTNPTEMETLITKPIEDAVAGVSGIQQITSHSELGTSNVSIQFYFGTDLDAAASDVIQKMQAIRNQLPTAAGSPSVIKADTSGQPIMHIAMQSKRESIPQLAALASNIVQPQLEQATDVGQINISQSSSREIDVNIPEAKLAAYGLTVTSVANAIASSNINVSTGFIQSGSQYANVRLIGEFASVDEIRNLRLTLSPGNASGETSGNGGGGNTGAAASGGASGTSSASSGPISINLSDIAQVVDTGSVATQSSDVNGVQAVGIDILKTTGGNTVAAADSAREQLKSLAKLVPPDVTFLITNDQSEQVHDNVNDVVASLIIGAIMAIAVVFIFLHNPRGTIIVAIAIPVSMIATFGPMYIFGFTLNTLSLLGLSLGIGVLVDDSIVVLENINRHLAMGEEPTVAAINGRSEIGYAALTLTAVDLVVFLPIGFMGGVIGQFFKSFGITVATATLFSMFVSFTLTPMLAARWYRKGEQMEFDRGFAGWFDRGFTRLENWYQRVLRGALRHPWLVVLAGNIFLILVFVLIGSRLGFRFSPDQDQNQVTTLVQCPPGASLSYTQNVTSQIERIIQNTPTLKHDTRFVTATIGNAGAGLNENGTQYAHVDVTLYNRHTALDYITGIFSIFHKKNTDPGANRNVRTRSDTEYAGELNRATHNITGAVIQASNVSGFGGGAPPLEVDLTGPDFGQLAQDAQQVQQMFGQVPGAYNVQNSFQNSEPEVDVRLDRQKAADLNLSVGGIGNALADAVAGNINSEYRDPDTGNQYYIRVQLADYDRANPQTIANIIVAYQNGAPVHLGDIAQVIKTVGPVKIDRYNRQREIAITAYMRPGFAPGNATLILNKQLAKMNLGQVTYSFGGESRSIQQEGGFLLTAFLLGLALSYMLMAALFNNMVYPLSIGLSVPQAWAGGFIALFIAHQSLNLIAMIGIIYLNAVVNKNAILVVDYTNTLRARGYKRLDALLEAGPVRLRPIMMTTFTIIVSTLPTALALGQGAGFRQSLGIVVEGGIILSLILSLIMVPCAYLLFDNFTNWLGRRTISRQIPIEALAYTGTDSPASQNGDGRGGDLKKTPGYGPAAAEPVRQEDPDEDREALD